MLSDKDINKLMQVFATKDEIRSIVREEISGEIGGMKEIVQKTFEVVEGLASRMDREDLSNAARDAQLTRHDGWIKHIATETKVKLKD
ncbi:hypothetical protein C4568_00435 [Candidatus Parcubacteria bacterium]|nr:MAG: hypothetical protein C4568_00435 [Candidatus Parcubacteria bacterium]